MHPALHSSYASPQSTNLLQSGNLNLGESVSPSMGAQSMGAQSMGAQSMGAQSMGAESAMLQNSMTDLEAITSI